MENIQVAARLRPLLDKELDSGDIEAFDINSQSITLLPQYHKKGGKKSRNKFIFDDVFSPDETNDTVYERKVRRVALSCLEGYNGTVFMYGQTGSGKTYTMLGYQNNQGLYNQAEAPITKNKLINDQQNQFGMENPCEKYADIMYDTNASSLMGNNGILI